MTGNFCLKTRTLRLQCIRDFSAKLRRFPVYYDLIALMLAPFE